MFKKHSFPFFYQKLRTVILLLKCETIPLTISTAKNANMLQSRDLWSLFTLIRTLLFAAFIFSALVLFFSKPSLAAEYDLYSYHNVPPFITSPTTGLSYDLVEYLNNKGEGRYRFKLNIVPRKRLDNILKENDAIIVPWVSPDWFGKDARSRYDWTAPIISDGNVYMSLSERAIEIANLNDLQGMVLGGVLGHRYSGLDDEVAKGAFTRINATNEQNLIRMIAGGRADIGVMAESAARYLVWEEGLVDKIYLASNKHSVFARRLLLSGTPSDLHLFLDGVITGMRSDPKWSTTIARYRFPIEIN